MKSLNVKKIAAFAAGAALIGTAFAGAAVTVDDNLGNFAFLQNGEPQVKVVLGSYALASDAVWAGNIASAIANMAYTTQTVAAAPAGSSGTTVAPVSVTVTNAANTIPAGQYGFTSFMASDRVDSSADNVYTASGSQPSIPGSLSAVKQVTRSQWPSLSLPNSGILDFNSANAHITPTEEQFINVYSQSGYDVSTHQYAASNMWAAIRYTFSTGLPYCVRLSQSGTTCSTGDRIFDQANTIYFLGAPWVVSNYDLNSGGTQPILELGKSYATRQRLEVGQTLNLSNGYKVKVASVGTTAETAANLIPCQVEVIKPDGTSSFDKIGGSEGTTKTLGGMHVRLDSALGGNPGSCILSVYSNVLTLTHNTVIDNTLYGDWRANLTNGTYSSSPAITELVLSNSNIRYPTSGGSKAMPNEALNLIQGAPGYVLTFNGIDLKPADYDDISVSWTTITGQVYSNGAPYTGLVNTGGSNLLALKFSSTRADAFRITQASGTTLNTRDVYVVVKNTTASDADANLTGSVLYYNNTYYVNLTAPRAIAGSAVVNLPALYYSSGSSTDTNVVPIVMINSVVGNATAGGVWIAAPLVNNLFNFSGNATSVNVTIPEVLNESSSVTDANWTTYFVMASSTATTGNFRDSTTATTSPTTVNYTAINRPSSESGTFTPPFCSPRGSCVNSVDTSQFAIHYATKLGHAQYILSSAGANLSVGGSSTVMCTPGVACAAAGGITLPVGTGAAGASSQQVMTRLNTATAPLVVLDSDASSTQPLIVVGGPFVNSVAATMEKCGSLASAEAGTAYVSVEGNKVCVAGYTADDTAAAARELIGFLASWSPATAISPA